MTTQDAIRLIGQTGTYRTTEGLTVEVEIRDVRTSYGKEQVQVTPMAGFGSAWIMLDRIKLAVHVTLEVEK